MTEESVFDFPQGLPAFEEEKAFVLIEGPQSEGRAARFPAKHDAGRPVFCGVSCPGVDASYQLAMVPEDLEDLDLDPGHASRRWAPK